MAIDPVAVRASNLDRLGHRAAVPRYDRGALKPGIVHIGAGAFNRAHFAVYLEDLLNQGGDPRWAECGIGLLPPDMKIHEALTAQDTLYSVLVRDEQTQDVRIIGSLTEHLYAPAASETVIERMAAPECSIVSMTVTEGGYFLDDSTREFLSSHPGIQHDLTHPVQPQTFVGYLAEAAERRRKRGLAPFTVQSCDNLQGNGKAARTALLSFAEMRSPALRQWIERNVAFPSSMVDRITPATTDEERAFLEERFGIHDLAPVAPEPFRQWIIEDTFSNGRPAWEKAGAQFTTDVVPFERIKMRLLNGAHLAIGYSGVLAGIPLVYEAMGTQAIHDLVCAFLEEVTPILPELPGMGLTEYKASLVHRFSNPAIKDTILRLCLDSTAKIAKFIVPSIGELLDAEQKLQVIPLVVACCLLSMCEKDEKGNKPAIVDPMAGLLSEFVTSGGRDVRLALAVQPVFGSIANRHPEFVDQVQQSLDSLRRLGVLRTIEETLSTNSTGRV